MCAKCNGMGPFNGLRYRLLQRISTLDSLLCHSLSSRSILSPSSSRIYSDRRASMEHAQFDARIRTRRICLNSREVHYQIHISFCRTISYILSEVKVHRDDRSVAQRGQICTISASMTAEALKLSFAPQTRPRPRRGQIRFGESLTHKYYREVADVYRYIRYNEDQTMQHRANREC